MCLPFVIRFLFDAVGRLEQFCHYDYWHNGGIVEIPCTIELFPTEVPGIPGWKLKFGSRLTEHRPAQGHSTLSA
jgi:hypothetical protein